MSVAENKELISRYLDAINGKPKPAAVVDEFISDADAVLKQHIAMYEAAFPGYALIPEDLIAEEDKVVVRFTMRGTYAGGLPGVPASGQQVESPGVIIYRIADGKIVEHWMGFDMMPVMQQLGAAPRAAA